MSRTKQKPTLFESISSADRQRGTKRSEQEAHWLQLYDRDRAMLLYSIKQPLVQAFRRRGSVSLSLSLPVSAPLGANIGKQNSAAEIAAPNTTQPKSKNMFMFLTLALLVIAFERNAAASGHSTRKRESPPCMFVVLRGFGSVRLVVRWNWKDV